jgi:cell division protein FtsW
MKELIQLKGDKVIWSFGFISVVFVYACLRSSNLAYLGHGTGNTLGYLVKHFFISVLGLIIYYRVRILEQYLKWHYR